MPRPFTQTIRSMEKDHPKTIMILLSIASVILTIWNIWFFCAQITIYESSIQAKVATYPEKIIPTFYGPGRTQQHKEHIILASFPLRVKDHIFQGQKGLFFPISNEDERPGSIQAIVFEITINSEDSSVYVRLKTVEPLHSRIPIPAETKGLIKLVVDHITPFDFVLMKIKKSTL